MSDESKPDSKDKPNIPFWRSDESKGRPERVGKHGVDLGDRGTYDTRNELNELTGKEWIHFLSSVWVDSYPPTAGDDTAFDLRKVHPSPKPPKLMRDIILFFTKRNQWILDPFAGVGGTLLGASICELPRKGIGIEINQDYIETYKEACREMGVEPHTMICDDARNMLSYEEIKNRRFDLILADPPYSDMMNREKNGQKKKLYGKNNPTPFSENQAALGNLDYKEFLSELKSILEKSVSRLKPKKYLVVFCKDMQPKENNPNLIHADVVNKLIEIPNLRYRGMRIWHDQSQDLYPFGYPYAFVMNQMHQYILIFRKEEE